MYIKDTTTKSSSPTDNAVSPVPPNNIIGTQKTSEQIFYAVQIPNSDKNGKQDVSHTKIIQNTVQQSSTYNVNLGNINLPSKGSSKVDSGGNVNNITINSNGEIINISSFNELENLIAQNMVQKLKQVNNNKLVSYTAIIIISRLGKKINKFLSSSQTQPPKKQKPLVKPENLPDSHLIQVELSPADINPDAFQHQPVKYDKMPHIKTTTEKFMYAIKLEDGDKNYNQNIVLNPLSQVPSQNYNQSNFQSSTVNTLLTNTNINNAANFASLSIPSKVNITSNMKIDNAEGLSDQFPGGETKSVCASRNQSKSNASIITTPTINIGGNVVGLQSFNNGGSISNGSINIPSAHHLASDENVPEPIQNSSNQTVKVHVCDVCHKIFKRREHLMQHIKLHTGFRPFTCERCNKSFMRKEHLLRHMTSHSGQKNFMCNICEKSFSRNDNLLKHKKTHDKQGKYNCEYCNKTFVMKHFYLTHKLSHENESKCNLSSLLNVMKA